MAGLPSVRGNEREDVDGAGVSGVEGVEVGTEAGANQDASSCVSDIFCLLVFPVQWMKNWTYPRKGKLPFSSYRKCSDKWL